MQGHFLDNACLPVTFIRQRLFNRMLGINATGFAALVNQLGPWRRWVLKRREYESMYIE